METTRPPGFPGNPPARMPRAPTPARSPPPRPLRRGEMTFRPTHDVGPRTQCISGLNHAAYGLPVNASRPGSPQAHASLGSGWRPTLAGWDWIPTGFRTRFRRSHHGILSPLTGLSRHTRWRTWSRTRSRRPTRGRTVRASTAAHGRLGAYLNGHAGVFRKVVEGPRWTFVPVGWPRLIEDDGACASCGRVWAPGQGGVGNAFALGGTTLAGRPARFSMPPAECTGRRA